MNVSGTPSFPGATALPDSLLVSWNIGVRDWLLVTSVVSHDSVVEEIVGVHRILSNEFASVFSVKSSVLDVSSGQFPKSLL